MNIKTKLAVPALAALLLGGPGLAPANAGTEHPHWNQTVKCETKDRDGRRIPTRVGNGDLGWNHFSGKHNIRKCAILAAGLRDKVDKVDGPRLEYLAKAIHNGRKVITIKIIVQYARQTKDKKYRVKKGEVVGVITAYCVGMNKCPNWVNQ
ncbi:hypothetical protein ABZV64_05705 [Streptomyces sp. NPDC004959]|uniref:hypothetical protein n=1 Tax=unclassified Streptomyces TaxID=2593676 RepID=UPI0006917D0E|nr:hypothetical protein [Streptomyces sp. NRRL F-5630]